MNKSTVEEIRSRFDADVERFSVLETGQSATMDAPLSLELVTSAASTHNPHATHVLDIGCGAGNYTLKLLQKLPNLNATLLDLSAPMLERAQSRVGAATAGNVETMQGDVREIELGENRFDIILAAAVLHHLRDDGEWESVFRKLHRALKPNGSLWIVDLMTHDTPPIQAMMWARYGEYLASLKDETYRDSVFAYIEKEDSPRSLNFQMEKLREAGFSSVEVLHKNGPFAAFGAFKESG